MEWTMDNLQWTMKGSLCDDLHDPAKPDTIIVHFPLYIVH